MSFSHVLPIEFNQLDLLTANSCLLTKGNLVLFQMNGFRREGLVLTLIQDTINEISLRRTFVKLSLPSPYRDLIE